MPGGILGGALKEIPRSASSRRPGRRAEPSLRANSLSGEHNLPQAPTTLAGARPCGEMVSGVQAKLVQQGVRERGPDTRCAEPDAAPVLGETFPPQTAHRLLVVGTGGGGGSMTSIDRNGISRGVHPKFVQHLAGMRAYSSPSTLLARDADHGQAHRERHGRGARRGRPRRWAERQEGCPRKVSKLVPMSPVSVTGLLAVWILDPGRVAVPATPQAASRRLGRRRRRWVWWALSGRTPQWAYSRCGGSAGYLSSGLLPPLVAVFRPRRGEVELAL